MIKMFNMFKRFSSCRKAPRLCICPMLKCGKCTREAIDINEITYDKLLEKVKEGAILIDVRTKQEFLEGHLEGAILIPYYEIKSKINVIVYDKNKTIILYCKNGGRSENAYKVLKKLGFKDIYNLKDGIEGI